MEWTKRRISIAVLMVITGAINTLSTKWADITKAPGYSGQSHYFNHPFLQTCGMFLGETLCLLAFVAQKKLSRSSQSLTSNSNELNNFSPLLLLPPAICDMVATSLMYFALMLTYASSFQMLRGSSGLSAKSYLLLKKGAVIIFTGIFSVAFLNRSLSTVKWLGIVVIIFGLAMVGSADVLYPDLKKEDDESFFDRNGIIAGDLLIIIAQIIVACQVCYEERFIAKYDIHPLQAVGWEGLFGFSILSVLVLILNFVPSPTAFAMQSPVIEDVKDAFYQMKNSWEISLAIIGNVLSIAFFNFAGISVTKDMNATTRMVLDSLRTLIIWIFSLSVAWQKFHVLQLFGFGILLIGMFFYNGFHTKIIAKMVSQGSTQENQTLLPNPPQ